MRSLSVDGTHVAVLADESAVAAEATRRLIDEVAGALGAHGTAHVVLTGGSSAVALYRTLAASPRRAEVPWEHVHWWWGDERFVPRDHPESNAGLAYRTLFAFSAIFGEDGAVGATGVDVEAGDEPGLIVDADKVHPIPAEEAIGRGESPAWAADSYAAEIRRLVPHAADVPVFDVILAGVGPDGHTLSLFPGSSGLAEDSPIVLAVDAPEHVGPRLARVSLAARILPAAPSVIVMSSGAGKAEVMASVLGTERDVTRWPAQAARLPNAVWLLDEAAAARLP
jgi:6-phosphogluconolactonase